MKLVAVKELPKITRGRHNLQSMIQEFVNGDTRIAKLDIGKDEYKSIQVAYKVIRTAVRNSRHPIKVHLYNGELYLEKI